MAIKKVGVIGAGQMGSGIAHVCAWQAMTWACMTSPKEAIETGLATINGNMARQVAVRKRYRRRTQGSAANGTSAASTFEQFGDAT
jgi:3-hydroxybutyryl-CoA dehydrogenase